MVGFSFECELARSGRAGCRGCKEKIEKSMVRVGVQQEVDSEKAGEMDERALHMIQGVKWYHTECLRKFRSTSKWWIQTGPETRDIRGFEDLPEEEKKKLSDLIDMWKERGVVVPKTKDEGGEVSGGGKGGKGKEEKKGGGGKGKGTNASNVKKMKSESEEDESDVDLDDGEKSKSSKRQKRKGKITEESTKKGKKMKNVSDYDGDDEKSSNNNGSSNSSSRSTSSSLPPPSSSSVLTKKQLKEISEKQSQLENKSILQLKEMLRINQQRVSGTKPLLVERVAEGMVLGAIPKCSSCGGGFLLFNQKTGVYTCPGYHDDDSFVRCGVKTTDVKRMPWKPSIA